MPTTEGSWTGKAGISYHLTKELGDTVALPPTLEWLCIAKDGFDEGDGWVRFDVAESEVESVSETSDAEASICNSNVSGERAES